jgi:hypothetical protein
VDGERLHAENFNHKDTKAQRFWQNDKAQQFF